MSLHLAFRKIEATEALKNHIAKRVEKFRKFVTYPIDIDVRLSLEKVYHCVEISVQAEYRTLVAISKTKDLYESIDMAVKKIESQLKKKRDLKKGHAASHSLARPATALSLASDVQADIPHREKKRKRA